MFSIGVSGTRWRYIYAHLTMIGTQPRTKGIHGKQSVCETSY